MNIRPEKLRQCGSTDTLAAWMRQERIPLLLREAALGSASLNAHLNMYVYGDIEYEAMLEQAVVYLAKESKHHFDEHVRLLALSPYPLTGAP